MKEKKQFQRRHKIGLGGFEFFKFFLLCTALHCRSYCKGWLLKEKKQFQRRHKIGLGGFKFVKFFYCVGANVLLFIIVPHCLARNIDIAVQCTLYRYADLEDNSRGSFVESTVQNEQHGH